ncbi:hypothetical protein D1AOALGA4SA_4879 [Olavius algarvensis Delta 1 endosymbiont]|nr:hypothetical protein D1AOALGA4SA_4879 [Olavius algarvensis Delta 1 endosymbiont]
MRKSEKKQCKGQRADGRGLRSVISYQCPVLSTRYPIPNI